MEKVQNIFQNFVDAGSYRLVFKKMRQGMGNRVLAIQQIIDMIHAVLILFVYRFRYPLQDSESFQMPIGCKLSIPHAGMYPDNSGCRMDRKGLFVYLHFLYGKELSGDASPIILTNHPAEILKREAVPLHPQQIAYIFGT